jgi:hypothetical protein
MRSEDWIQGPVLQMFSNDVFEMQVLWVGRNNDFPYNARERIRIESSALSLTPLTEEDAQAQLQNWLLGKTVRCHIHARDLQNVLVCEVEILDDEFIKSQSRRHMSKYPTQELGELAEVFVGVARHGRGLSWEEKNPEANLIGMKALRPQGIDFHAVEIVHLSPRTNLENYKITAHDILLPCRGTDLRVIVAPEKAAGMLIDSNIMVIRCGPHLAHQLLAAYFQHYAGQAALLRVSQSTTAQKNLTVRLVRKITIPVPPPEVQHQAVALLEAGERQHHWAMQVAEKRRALAQHLAINMLFPS